MRASATGSTPCCGEPHREGEPEWDGGSLGSGRPGWHIECACIALDHLGLPVDVQGGGTDLVFPHHEMSSAHGRALSGSQSFAGAFVHQGMVGLDGEKMSKSKGNLVLVSRLRRDGIDPMAIRLALLARHHAHDWMWTHDQLVEAQQRLATWREALSCNGGPVADQTVDDIRAGSRRRPRQPAGPRGGRPVGQPGTQPRRRRPRCPRHARSGPRRPARRPPLTPPATPLPIERAFRPDGMLFRW